MAGVGFTPRRPMAAEDIRNLQVRTCHERRASGGRLGLVLLFDLLLGLVLLGPQRREAVERAHDRRGSCWWRRACRAPSCLELGVAQRTRAIMLTFYVIESQSAAAPGRLLADDAGHSGRGMRPHPRL